MKSLRGLRVLSLALNLPGPAALMHLRQLGARCIKFEPLSGDPMVAYSMSAYDEMHQGVKVLQADLKTESGQKILHKELARADILLSSFRPSAMKRLGLDWRALHAAYPKLSQVEIVGDVAEPEIPGHDLTYLAEHGLVRGTQLPATLFADMGGSMLAVQAALQAALLKAQGKAGQKFQVGLSQAAKNLALPRTWGLTTAQGTVGGAHSFYQVYECKNGRVAVAALEAHFAKKLANLIDLPKHDSKYLQTDGARRLVKEWFAAQSREKLGASAIDQDLPMHCLK